MGEVTTIGLDIAKSVFQVHGVDADGQVVLRQRLTRARVLPFFRKLSACRVGIEACATAHHWARELRVLGHDVRLMPPAYVKPYVKRQKNDAADAEAICEAVGRPSMRFVEPKTVEQQSEMMLHRVRLMLTRQRTQAATPSGRTWPSWASLRRSAARGWQACSPSSPTRPTHGCRRPPAAASQCSRGSCSFSMCRSWTTTVPSVKRSERARSPAG